MGRLAALRAERSRERRAAERWTPVTREMIVRYADPTCPACSGDGITVTGGLPKVCSCAPPLFAAANRHRMRPGPGGSVEVQG